MIALHSVTKERGRGAKRKVVLDNLNWTIPPRGLYVILGQKGAGKTTFIDVINGTIVPTMGWVERQGAVCSPRRLSRSNNRADHTPKQLARRLAQVYHADPDEIMAFVANFGGLQDWMNRPTRMLSPHVKQRLTLALTYALPADFYVFDNGLGLGNDRFGKLCRQALDARRENAALIITTSRSKVAETFDGIGGILHAGQLTLFSSIAEATSVFNQLPPPLEVTNDHGGDSSFDDDDDPSEGIF